MDIHQAALISQPDSRYARVNPFRCRMWPLHDRIEDYISEASCRKELESFKKYGQFVPVLARRVIDDPEFDAELVFGARRLFIARQLSKPLIVEFRDLSEHQAIIAMAVENLHRQDISPYERGRSYSTWLNRGLFASQEELARALGISASQVSRLMKIGRLPNAIIRVFGRPTEIMESWGLELIDALSDPERGQQVLKKARALTTSGSLPSPRNVYEILISVSAKIKPRLRPKDDVVKGQDGRALFRVRRQQKALVVMLPLNQSTYALLPEIQTVIATILERSSPIST